jgi:S-adenosylmethionine hydrolase
MGKGQVTRLCTNYAEGVPGEAFGIIGSMGFLEIASNRGSAQQMLGVGKGTAVNLVMEAS